MGREALIDHWVERLTAGEGAFFSTESLPGVGKTTLAVMLAHHRRVLAHFQGGVLWASLGPRGEAMAALGAWAEALGEDPAQLPRPSDRQQPIQRRIGQRRVLLIIDDAWNLEAAQALRCGGPHCCHLLTTRDKGIARAFAGTSRAETLPILDEAPAYELLTQLAPEACAADPSAAQALAQAAGGLPLALELLGGYLAAPEHSLFVDLTQEAFEVLADPRQRLQLAQVRLGSPGGQAVSLRATIALSLEGLPLAAVQAFKGLGAFAPKPARFSREAAQAVTQAEGVTLATLAARNLLEVESEGETVWLTLHQTLADVARELGGQEAKERHQDYYLALVNKDREDWRRIEAAYEQIRQAWAGLPDELVLLEWVWALRIYQGLRGLWPDVLAWIDRALAVARHQGLGEKEGTLLHNMGYAYNAQGQRQQALEYYHRTLLIREEVGDRAGLARTLTDIGAVYDAQGQRQQALEYYHRALPIQEEVGDRAGLATTLNNIGTVYDAQGQRQQALECYHQALPICKEVGESPRDSRRLQILRDWSHEEIYELFSGGPGTGGAAGL